MDNQDTTPVGADAHAATTASTLKELVLEFIDPVKNYGYLYLLTIVSLVTNARIVVASIITPPTEAAHNREDLRTLTSSHLLGRLKVEHQAFLTSSHLLGRLKVEHQAF